MWQTAHHNRKKTFNSSWYTLCCCVYVWKSVKIFFHNKPHPVRRCSVPLLKLSLFGCRKKRRKKWELWAFVPKNHSLNKLFLIILYYFPLALSLFRKFYLPVWVVNVNRRWRAQVVRELSGGSSREANAHCYFTAYDEICVRKLPKTWARWCRMNMKKI